jgi:hypothetical protein
MRRQRRAVQPQQALLQLQLLLDPLPSSSTRFQNLQAS